MGRSQVQFTAGTFSIFFYQMEQKIEWNRWLNGGVEFCQLSSSDGVTLDGDTKVDNFIWLQLVFGPKPCFLGSRQLAKQKVNIH